MKTNKKDSIEKTINALIYVVGRISSDSYALVVLKTILDKIEKNFSIAKEIKVKDNLLSLNYAAITISDKVNSYSDSDIKDFLNHILSELLKPFSKNDEAKSELMIQIKGYLGHEYEVKLKNMGVKI